MHNQKRREMLLGAGALASAAMLPSITFAQSAKLRVGLMLPYTGTYAQLGVAIECTRLTRVPVFPWNTGPLVPDRKRHGRQAHRHAIPDIVIHTSERLRLGEVARIVITQGHLHAVAPNARRRAAITFR